MDPITNFDSSYKFIELHRTFHELSKYGNENNDIDISRALGIGEWKWRSKSEGGGGRKV